VSIAVAVSRGKRPDPKVVPQATSESHGENHGKTSENLWKIQSMEKPMGKSMKIMENLWKSWEIL